MEVTPLELIQTRFPGKSFSILEQVSGESNEWHWKSRIAVFVCLYIGRREEEYRHQLGSFGVTGELALRPILSLSGGQKSRLAFALLSMSRYHFPCNYTPILYCTSTLSPDVYCITVKYRQRAPTCATRPHRFFTCERLKYRPPLTGPRARVSCSSSAHARNLELLRLYRQQASEELYFYQVSWEESTNYGSKEATIFVHCKVQTWSYQLVPSERGNKHATARHF